MAGDGSSGTAGVVVCAHRTPARDGNPSAGRVPFGFFRDIPVCDWRVADAFSGNRTAGYFPADALASHFLLPVPVDGGRPDRAIPATRESMALADPLSAARRHHVLCTARLIQIQRSHRIAIDPDYMGLPAEDGYGIRAIAKRSLLAENQKDPGAATVFPELAPEWREQVHAQQGIESFDRAQFHRLKTRYDVSWTVLPAAAKVPLECPYRNEAAQVCKVE
jgi:hypothetical protein